MEMLIYGLVHANAADEALTTAKQEVFTPLVDRGTFANVEVLDREGRAGRWLDRWNEYPPVARADRATGDELIEAGWRDTVTAYETNFDRVEDLLAGDRSTFWEDGRIHRQYDTAFRAISEFEGPHTFLYDEAGQGIRHRSHLTLIQNAYEDLVDETTHNPYRDMDLYVVPAACRY